MATYQPRVRKDGTPTYLIQVKQRCPVTGNNKFITTTWKNPDGIRDLKRAKQAATAFGYQWEEDLKGHRNVQQGLPKTATFNTVADEWYEHVNKSFSESYKVSAYDILVRLKQHFGDMRMGEISAFTVANFFKELGNFVIEKVSAQLKPCAKEKLNTAVKDYGVRKAAREEDCVTRPTLYNARLGNIIEWQSAKAICEKFDFRTSDIFDRIVTQSNYKKNTIKKYKNVLSPIFEFAIIHGVCTENFSSSRYIKKTLRKNDVEDDEKDIVLLTEQETMRLLDTLDNDEEINKAIGIGFLAMLGLRRAEMIGLQWHDIDWGKQIIKIRRNRMYVRGKGSITGPTKNKTSMRDLRMPDRLFKRVKEWKDLHDKLNGPIAQGYIFCHLDGIPFSPHYLRQLLNRYLLEAGCTQVSCHKLRHGWITTLIDKGKPVSHVSKWAGHASPRITLEVYTQYRKEHDSTQTVLDDIFG